MTTPTVSSTEQHISNEHALLGASLLASQKVEWALFSVISTLAKALPKEAQQSLDLDLATFLRDKPSEQDTMLTFYEHMFGAQLPLSKNELNDFIYHRNLVTRGFWQVTGANVKGGEKLANPELYLKEFLAKCEYWQVMIDTQTK
ncbi:MULTISPECIES: hypothetical protein [Vibrio]|uniref:Uncharacterized protein n=2 Tax=Vibrio cyclitrophicus TaxID=47951 RepID=A0AAN0LYL5_9VIBR|nr:hypothetical protein [Vibrio cyclitrophicus]MBU2932365.1 hypothetical protein [Vibrio cyclitrophicus]OBT23422.1 hypothetical protein A9263_10140 [Vibrio cyclitrophicus]OCH46360.1 hypothetical protein A6D96_22360 [Vibrio cyclitrophicus]OED90800.1 hypothetical protein OAQ_01355 [Vibrio cyclitrophicus ZF30]OEE16474.1 hypothetical protein OC1_10500 [Vibrio cyclitrophicus ZF207]